MRNVGRHGYIEDEIDFMDTIYYKIREDGYIHNGVVYVILGVTLDGKKESLSITIGTNESAKFWLGMLNDLKNIVNIAYARY